MDLELHCLTSTLNKRQARRFPADSHQRTGACDLTIYVKESLIVFGNMFYSSDGWWWWWWRWGGVGRCLPLFLICWQNKFVGQRCEECVGAVRLHLHNCSFRLGSDHSCSETVRFTAHRTHACRHHGQF